jgi:Family of unknown function (DUF5335)
MHPRERVDQHDFTICSHSNPIDPAQYPGEGESFGEERPHRTGISEAAARGSAGRDRCVRIAPQEWRVCFDRLSRSHRGWLATLAVSEQQRTSRAEARDLPLAGIVLESGRKAVWTGLGNLEHVVGDPSAVWLWIGPDGAEEALEISSSDATRTVLSFRSALPSEMVDRIAPFPTSP